MKEKVIKLLILGVALQLIKYLNLILCFHIQSYLKYHHNFWDFAHSIKNANEISLTRMLLYSLFWILSFYFTIDKIHLKSSALKISLMNLIAYIFISFLYACLLPPAFEFFSEPFFFFVCLSTLLSPFILSAFKFKTYLYL